MSEATSTPGGPPAGFYDDPERSGRQRWFDGVSWTNHFQAAAIATQQPTHVPVGPPARNVKQGRDNSQYVRQQKSHSFVMEWVVLGVFTLWIRPIYFALSPNHYWTL